MPYFVAILATLGCLMVFVLSFGVGVFLYFLSSFCALTSLFYGENEQTVESRYRWLLAVLPLGVVLIFVASLLMSGSKTISRTDRMMVVAKGEEVFKSRCGMCHSKDEGKVKVGPSLFRIINRPIGSVGGYPYSGAMKNKKGKWTEEELDRFISDVVNYEGGTNMIIQSIDDEVERNALIAYLGTLDQD